MSQSAVTFGTCRHVSSRVQCGPMESGFAVTVNAAQPRQIIPQQACTVGHCEPGGLDHVPNRPIRAGSPELGHGPQPKETGRMTVTPSITASFPV